MDRAAFWKIVDGCKRSSEPEVPLRKKLERLDAEEVAAFDALFRGAVERAFRWDLWGAAYLIEGGCSEDGLIYFLQGLIAKGRDVYERALEDPDSLATVRLSENEELGQVAAEVYHALTGKKLRHAKSKCTTPKGKRWDFEDATAAAKRLPKLHARFPRRARADPESEPKPTRAKSPPEKRAPVQDPFDPFNQNGFHALLERARAARERKQWPKAIELYGKIAAMAGSNVLLVPLVQAESMIAHAEAGDRAQARVCFAAALRARESYPAHWMYDEQRSTLDHQVAWFLWKHGADDELAEALRHIRSAKKYRSAPLSVRATEMEILLRMGRTADARKLAEDALKKDRRHPELQAAKKRWGL